MFLETAWEGTCTAQFFARDDVCAGGLPPRGPGSTAESGGEIGRYYWRGREGRARGERITLGPKYTVGRRLSGLGLSLSCVYHGAFVRGVCRLFCGGCLQLKAEAARVTCSWH